MNNKLEHILLSLLSGTTILLGLSFWLNINFGFNLFYREHWNALAQMQATNTPVNPYFYISVITAIILFFICIIVIYIPLSKRPNQTTVAPQNATTTSTVIPNIPNAPDVLEAPTPMPATPKIAISRPPQLNLPTNIHEIATIKYQSNNSAPKPHETFDEYNGELAKIFSDNGYVVKPNPRISGFTPNLFAIGNNEVLWIGAVNCEVSTMEKAVEKLNSVFHDTLQDIKINIYPFIVKTDGEYDGNSEILIVPSTQVLAQFISENGGEKISEFDQDNFDAYSEFIDTIITYIKNV